MRCISLPCVFCILIIFSALFLPQNLWAEPIISEVEGSFLEGETVEISGLGFGSKDTPPPLFYDDFQNGNDGEYLSSGAGEGWIVGENPPQYSTWGEYFGGDIVCKQTLGKTYNGFNETCEMSLQFPELNQVYFSGIVYFQKGWYSDNFPESIKFLGHWGDSYENLSGYTEYPRPEGGPGRVYSDICLDQGSDPIQQRGITTLETNGWHRLEFWHGNTPDTTNESIYIEIDGQRMLSASGNNPGCTRSTISLVPRFHDVEEEAGLTVLWSSVYVDDTLARVEIGDAPIYEDCTHCEIQISSEWEDGSIQFILNHGKFTPENDVYVYVLDENGEPNSQGYQVNLMVDGVGRISRISFDY